jgi:hypothetical protein
MCDVPISQGDLEPKGHNQHCPLAQCESCKLTGHITDVCTFRQCCDVEIHYLNLLLLTKARNTIESYFDATDQASVQPNALHIDGKFSESTDWNHVKQRFAISDRQVLELKSVAHEFKRATTREYERATRGEPSVQRADPLRISGISNGSKRHRPVVFEWPLAVASAWTSAATTPHGTPNKKPKIELRTDF